MSSLLCRSNGHLRRWSNGHWRARFFSASVPSDDALKVQKGGKKVPKDERKEMVLSFVNKYRATNAGKFPTASEARKQVGGCYYIIRKIMQELAYESRTSSMNIGNSMKFGKVVVKVNEKSKQVEDVSGTLLRRDSEINKDVKTDVDIDDSSLKNVGTEEGPDSSTSFVKAMSEDVKIDVDIGDSGLKDVGTEEGPESSTSFVKDECSTSERQKHISEGGAEGDIHQSHEKPEHGGNERSHSDGVLDLDVPQTKSEQHHQSSESDKFSRAPSEKKNDDQELSKKSSIWGNLKTGIMKIWNKW